MPVPPPSSGQTIEPADVVSMHDAVRQAVNATLPNQIKPGAFNSWHVPSLVQAADTQDYTGSMSILTEPAGFVDNDPAEILADWSHLAALDLDNGGLGYTLDPCLILLWCTVRVKDWTSKASRDWQVWINLNYVLDGVDMVDVADSRPCWGQEEYTSIEETITIVKVIDQSAAGAPFTIDRVRVFATMCRGVSGPILPDTAQIEGALVGLLALQPAGS